MRNQTDCARFEAVQDRRLAEEIPLTDAEHDFLDDHSRGCPSCGLERAGLEALQRAGADTEASELSDADVSGAVRQALGRARKDTPARRPWLRPLPVAAVVVAAVVAVVMLLPPGSMTVLRIHRDAPHPVAARLTLVAGQVQVDGRAATARSRLEPGQWVRVGAGARAVLTFGDGTTALLSKRTEVGFVASAQGSTHFILRKGAATFRVSPRPAHRRVEVEASWGRIEVVGTVFRVTDTPGNRRVQVARGRVRVRLPQRAPLLLVAGQELDAVGSPEPLRVGARQKIRAAMKLVAKLPIRGGGVLAVVAAAPRVQVAVGGVLVGTAPVALVLQPGLRTVAAVRGQQVLATRSVTLKSSQRTEVSFDLRSAATTGGGVTSPPAEPPATASRPEQPRVLAPVRRPAAAITAPRAPTPTPTPTPPSTSPGTAPTVTPPATTIPVAPPKETVAQLLSRAAQLRAQRSWTLVIGVYRRIIQLHARAPEAATALVLMGQVQLRQLRRARSALASFQRYLRYYVRGPLAPEAAWGRIESLRQLGRRQAERQACQALLKAYPRSIYAARVRSRLKVLARPR